MWADANHRLQLAARLFQVARRVSLLSSAISSAFRRVVIPEGTTQVLPAAQADRVCENLRWAEGMTEMNSYLPLSPLRSQRAATPEIACRAFVGSQRFPSKDRRHLFASRCPQRLNLPVRLRPGRPRQI